MGQWRIPIRIAFRADPDFSSHTNSAAAQYLSRRTSGIDRTGPEHGRSPAQALADLCDGRQRSLVGVLGFIEIALEQRPHHLDDLDVLRQHDAQRAITAVSNPFELFAELPG